MKPNKPGAVVNSFDNARTFKGFVQAKNTGAAVITGGMACKVDIAQLNTDVDPAFLAVEKCTTGTVVAGAYPSGGPDIPVNGKFLMQVVGPCLVLVEGTTDVAAEDGLEADAASAGALEKNAGPTEQLTTGAVALAAVTDAGPAAANVWLLNRYGLTPTH